MTIPTQMNCIHSSDGWCLRCVENLTGERDDLFNRMTTAEFERNALQSENDRLTAVNRGYETQANADCLLIVNLTAERGGVNPCSPATASEPSRTA